MIQVTTKLEIFLFWLGVDLGLALTFTLRKKRWGLVSSTQRFHCIFDESALARILSIDYNRQV